MLKTIISALSAVLFLAVFAIAGEPSNVEMFSPEGSVKNVRQVTARFSDQMAAFGDPRLFDPFEVKCPEKGKGRWVDSKTWSYDFNNDVPAGVLCEFNLKSEIRTLTGNPVTGQRRFTFDTGGPSIGSSMPDDGHQWIDERQIFILSLDAWPDEESVVQNVYCSVEGIKERVGIRLIKGAEKGELFKAVKYKQDKTPNVALQCRQAFPPSSEVKLIWGKGISSQSGIATKEDQILTFKTRLPFNARFACMKERKDSLCVPISPMTLTFSSPVLWSIAGQATIRDNKGRVWTPKRDENEHGEYVYSISFQGPFPEKSSFSLNLPKYVRDDAGRLLSNQNRFPMTIKTDTYPALAKFPSRFGIIELNDDALMPLTVRNIETEIAAWSKSIKAVRKESDQNEFEQSIKGNIHKVQAGQEEKIIEWLGIVATARRNKPVLAGLNTVKKITVPRPGRSKDFEVIGIPFREPGLYIVELESKILGSRLLEKPGPMYVQAAALVTNMAAHFKWGRESSVVWITSLDKGEPVNGVKVDIRDCRGRVLWGGTTGYDGIARIDSVLPKEDALPRCTGSAGEQEELLPALSGIRSGLFVFAKKDNDVTFTHSGWDEGIEPWRFNLSSYYNYEKSGLVTHTVFDRTLLHAGEEVHMKHFLRERTMKGLYVPNEINSPEELIIKHAGSDELYVLPVKWRENGTAETNFKIPDNAKLGTYNVFLSYKKGEKRKNPSGRFDTGSFRVEEFRVPLMKGIIQPPKWPVVNAREIEVDVSVSYLSGGSASDLPVKVRTDMQPRTVSFFDDYEEYDFSGGRVETGIVRLEDYEDDGDSHISRKGKNAAKLKTTELTLDKGGMARVKFTDLPDYDAPKYLFVELEYADPNGELQTIASRIPVYPSGVVAGIKTGGKDVSSDNLKYEVAVIDLKGTPAAGAEVETDIFQIKTYSHRRRITGGFYAYDNATETTFVKRHCQGRTDVNGIIVCEGVPSVTGEAVIQAVVKDSNGNPSYSKHYLWIPGKDDQWAEARNDDRIDLIPEKKHYEVNEKARFRLKMPFREATALVTVECEGVIDAYIKKIMRNNPFFEIPVRENYTPNVFVSALVVKGRSGNTKPTATFDPGKPAYKLGISEIKVGWAPHELKVKVSTDRNTYKIREQVKADIKVTKASGSPPPRGSELAVAVIDEGLLELKPNESWKLVEAMMKKRGYEIKTSTAQMMVVGKRHFGRKALPHGGGGGRHITREFFDTLVYWKGVVALDENGEASVKFPLNDALSSFRVVAVACGGKGFFGTGETSIRSTQELMILSGIPPAVRETDRFNAGFVIRNASQRDMEIEAGLSANDKNGIKRMDTIRRLIPGGQSREIGWDITVPAGISKIDYEAFVKEIGGDAYDSLKFTQKVTRVQKIRTFQATISQVKRPLTMQTEMPKDAVPATGGIDVHVIPKLSGALSGAVEYMDLYPYICLEQKLSKAVVLRNRGMWKAIMSELPSYIDQDGLVKYFPSMRLGSDILTSYVVSVSAEAGYEIPENIRKRMFEGLKGFLGGRVVRYLSLSAADLSVRKIAAADALSRYNEFKPELLESVSIEPDLWPLSAVLDWTDLLLSNMTIPDRLNRLKHAEQIIRSRLNLQGTTMGYSTEKSDNLWWLMTSPDVNAARMMLIILRFDGWKEEVPRTARGLIGRMKNGRWDTTVANAWGVLAMERFSNIFESIPVSGSTVVKFDGLEKSIDWPKTPGGDSVLFSWQRQKETLNVMHNGNGNPWVTIRAMAAIPLKEPVSSGFRIRKTIIPLKQKDKSVWTRGDVARVRLELESQADMSWVVVNDPVPAGSVVLGSGLGRDSALLADGEFMRGAAQEIFRERSFEALKIYYEYVPKGKWTVEYTLRLNNGGIFNIPETRVEALYSPEMFGEMPNKKIEVLF